MCRLCFCFVLFWLLCSCRDFWGYMLEIDRLLIVSVSLSLSAPRATLHIDIMLNKASGFTLVCSVELADVLFGCNHRRMWFTSLQSSEKHVQIRWWIVQETWKKKKHLFSSQTNSFKLIFPLCSFCQWIWQLDSVSEAKHKATFLITG